MRASKKTQYALRAMIVLAKNKNKVCSLRFISEREMISLDYLEKIFSCLEKKGLVASKRGATGGYRLARGASKITLADIFLATEENIAIVDCVSHKCKRDKNCTASSAWKEVNRKIEKALSSVKLVDLIN